MQLFLPKSHVIIEESPNIDDGFCMLNSTSLCCAILIVKLSWLKWVVVCGDIPMVCCIFIHWILRPLWKNNTCMDRWLLRLWWHYELGWADDDPHLCGFDLLQWRHSNDISKPHIATSYEIIGFASFSQSCFGYDIFVAELESFDASHATSIQLTIYIDIKRSCNRFNNNRAL